MRNRLISIAAVGAALALLLGSSASGRATRTVEVGDDFFNPSSLTVKEGTYVNFNWIGTGDHDVYKQSGPGRMFTSGIQSGEGIHYSRKFKRRGQYVLACTLHPKMLMNLKVRRR